MPKVDVAFVGSHNPKLSAIRIVDQAQFLEIVIRTLVATKGDITLASDPKFLNIGKTTIFKWVKQHSELREAIVLVKDGQSVGPLLQRIKTEAAAAQRTAKGA